MYRNLTQARTGSSARSTSNKDPCQYSSTRLGSIPQPNPVENSLSGKVNIESIRDLEEEIRGHERIIIKLKRARNSLLNVSKLPPEVLGNIFRWNVTLKDEFGGLEEGSHNFLFVCHHWSEVALHTPEVWSFWGNTPEDWGRWPGYRHSGTAPLDLVLGNVGHDGGTFDISLRDALRDRATRDAIRRVHLWSRSAAFLSSVIFPLNVTCGGLRSNSVESFILLNEDVPMVDLSGFFAHYLFPKLQRLELYRCSIASWDLLTSRTGVLTTLVLRLFHPSPTPTTSQLLSILSSNPTLRKVWLSRCAVPDDGGGNSRFQVPLHHLKELVLDGGLRHVVGLLHRLDHPTNMDKLDISVGNCAVADISQIIGPYLRGYLRRRGRSQKGLGLSVSRTKFWTRLSAGDEGGIGLSTLSWQIPTFLEITMELDRTRRGLLEKEVLDLIAHAPRDEIVWFSSWGDPITVEHISDDLPNIRTLQFCAMSLSAVFPESNLDGNERIFPSLQHIILRDPIVDGGDWSPLTTFLVSRVSSGSRLDSLTVTGSTHMCLGVEGFIRSMVKEFEGHCTSGGCPFDTCPEE